MSTTVPSEVAENAFKQQNKGRKAVLPPLMKNKSLKSDSIPSNLLVTLTKSTKKFENLGPKKYSTRRPANVWNHEKRREKFNHLIQQPTCYCGAGRDISYLLDAVQANAAGKKQSEKEETETEGRDYEKLATHTIPETIIPSEFHIVKHKGANPLDIHDDKFASYPNEHENHETLFPSMNPSGRQEALQLLQTMNTLLKKAGIEESPDDHKDDNQGGDSEKQIEKLLALVKNEQKIYNIIFHEVIRQVSVECIERGQLLAELRNRYAQMLDRVPKQVKSLHEEVLAQRALDRRLTEELARFKTSVTLLTKELHEVHAHDEEVTRQAIETQEELNEALKESEKNASLLAEYHDLYELQRRRLDYQLEQFSSCSPFLTYLLKHSTKLIEERDLWAGSAHMLSVKVTDKHNLTTVRRLHLYEKSWYKHANRFALLLGQEDEKQLQILASHVHDWQDVARQFDDRLCDAELAFANKLKDILYVLNEWSYKFERVVTPEEGSVHPLGDNDIEKLFDTLKSWEDIFNQELERFTGDVLLSCEDDLLKLNNCMDNWIDVSFKVFANHPNQDGSENPNQKTMTELNKRVKQLHDYLQLRMSGENGVARGTTNLVNSLDTWVNKLNVMLNDGESLFDSEWVQLADYLQVQWKGTVKSLIRISSRVDDEEIDSLASPKKTVSQESWASSFIDVDEVISETQSWLSTTIDGFETENSNIIEQIATTHSNMIRWMITVLIRIAPNKTDENSPNDSTEDDSSGLGAAILMESSSASILDRATILFNWIRSLTDLVVACCREIVISLIQPDATIDFKSPDQDYVRDLKKIEVECQGWMNTANLLLREVTGDIIPIDNFQPAKVNLPEVVESKPQERANSVNEQRKDSTSTEASRPNTDSATPFIEEAEDTKENEEEKKDNAEKAVSHPEEPRTLPTDGTSSPDDIEMHVIGHDDNVKRKPMETVAEESQQIVRETSSETDMASASMSLEALSTLDQLQSQLLATEERAQKAEERAFKAESSLKEAEERIRALERSISRTGISSATESKPQSTQSERKT